MAGKNDGTLLNVESRWSRLESYIDLHKKMVSVISIIVALLIGLIIAYRYWYMPSQEEDAEVAMRTAQYYFNGDSLNRAIKGDGVHSGFLDIADQYGSTPAGQLANYYLGLCYYQKKDYQKAIDYLEKFNAGDILVSANAAGVEGDAEMQLNNTDKAIEYYMEAVKRNDNTYTAPMYMKKAALAYEIKGDYANALSLYQNIKTKYYSSSEASDIDKYIARTEVKGGK